MNAGTRGQAIVVNPIGEDFNALVNKNPFTMVLFTAPWCNHCEKVEVEFNKAAEVSKTIPGLKVPVAFAQVDGSVKDNQDILDKYEIDGYPTLYLAAGADENGNPRKIEFDGESSQEGIIHFIEHQIFGLVRNLNTVNDLQILVSALGHTEADHRPIVVGLFDTSDASAGEKISENQKLINMFENIATNTELPQLRFAKTTPGSEVGIKLKSSFGASAPSILVYRYHTVAPALLTKKEDLLNETRIQEFIDEAILIPTVATIVNEENFEKSVLLQHGKNFLVMYYAPWCKHSRALHATFEEVAKTLKNSPKDNIIPIKMDASKASDDFKDVHGIVGYPLLMIYRNGNRSPAFEIEFTTNNILEWATQRSQAKFIEVNSSDDIEKLFGETEEEMQARLAKEEEERKRKGDTAVIPPEPERVDIVIVAAKSAVQNATLLDLFDSIAFRSPNQYKYCKLSPTSNIDHLDGLYSFRTAYGRFKNNKNYAKYKGELDDADALVAWITRSSLPNALYYDDDSYMETIVATQIEIVVFVFIPENHERERDIIYTLQEVGDASRDDALFAYTYPDNEQLSEFFGISMDIEEPVVKVLQVRAIDDMTVFNAPEYEDIDKDYLESLVDLYYEGKLEQFEGFEEADEEQQDENQEEQEEEGEMDEEFDEEFEEQEEQIEGDQDQEEEEEEL